MKLNMRLEEVEGDAKCANIVNGVPHMNGVNEYISYCNTSMLHKLRKFCCANRFI